MAYAQNSLQSFLLSNGLKLKKEAFFVRATKATIHVVSAVYAFLNSLLILSQLNWVSLF